MLLNGIVWIIIQHSKNWSTFTLDAFLIVFSLIYKNLFYHQPFDVLSILLDYFQKKHKFGQHSNIENKDMKYIN